MGKTFGELQPYDTNESNKDDDKGEADAEGTPNTAGKKQLIKSEDEAANKQNQKPKYDKNADFFDSITNSTQEPVQRRGRGNRGGNRGGYRGGDRGGFDRDNRGGRGRGRGKDYYHGRDDFDNDNSNFSRKNNYYDK